MSRLINEHGDVEQTGVTDSPKNLGNIFSNLHESPNVATRRVLLIFRSCAIFPLNFSKEFYEVGAIMLSIRISQYSDCSSNPPIARSFTRNTINVAS